ncbi:MAG: hypothetical protein L6R48_14360, partial [Planctomycetes bacterium]|nr:hypothetical protein [Planctomycetota bacterium]
MSSRRLLGGGGPSGPERSGGAAPVRTGTGDGEAGPCDAVAAPAEQGRFCANSTSDALTEAYLDGTLDAAGAATLAAALHAGGAEAAAIRAR